jgi:tRNA threonylcarbamoyladenosine biosynthesis protein TsaB
MLTIIIDSSTDISTAILANNEQIISKRTARGSALKNIHTCIQEVLEAVSLQMSDINRVGVVQGPGSWTGLHVAITSAKTFAQVYDLPLIPISFIDALAFSAQRQECFLLAAYRSSRGSIFCRGYEDNSNRPQPVADHQHLSLDEFIELIREFTRPVRLVGEIFQDSNIELERFNVHNVTFEHIPYPSDHAMVRMVNEEDPEGKSIQDMLFLEPLYLQMEGEGPRLFKGGK